jgi:hypothetical protein
MFKTRISTYEKNYFSERKVKPTDDTVTGELYSLEAWLSLHELRTGPFSVHIG